MPAAVLLLGLAIIGAASSLKLGDKPEMQTLLSFPARKENMDLTKLIGPHYSSFGVILLGDSTGMTVQNFVSMGMGDPRKINQQIFQEWLMGRGRRPVSWQTLLDCLKEAELHALVDSIQEVMDDGGAYANRGSSHSSEDEHPRKSGGRYPIKNKMKLFQAVKEIGNWDSLCTSLGVPDSQMEAIRFSDKASTLKKQDCLTKYYDGGKADWAEVVDVVAEFPFENLRLACKIAVDHMNMEKSDCIASYQAKQEL